MRKVLAIVLVCSLASFASANLLTNGGFELGATGWTQYSTWWGSGSSWNYSYTPAYEGSQALSLTAPTGSFGLYQVIDVAAGLPVTVSFALKATDNGNNWYEVLLFDGAVNGSFIDSSTTDADIMFKWESGGGYDGTPQSTWTTGSDGRTPTGTQMTVAVKAGGGVPFGAQSAIDGQFDALDVIQVPEPTIIGLGLVGLLAIRRRRLG